MKSIPEFHRMCMESLEDERKQRVQDMKDRVSYAILQHNNHLQLENQVIEYLKEGWCVTGGISVTISGSVVSYYQAMVRL